ncbi:MAG: TonB-dependent receptor, partial [Rhodothermales bacterium]
NFDDLDPITISGYVQDKMEFENFIVNAGVRFDYFDSRTTVPADPSDPNIHTPFKKIHIYHDLNGDGIITVDEETEGNKLTVEEREAFWWRDTKSKFQISPRLGVAYPISAEGVIHFSYGHFLQIPTLNRLFQNFGYKIPNRSGGYGPFGNPDLDAQKTVMYEIGVRQAIGDVVLDLTGYYRDVRDWVSTSRLITTELPGVNYVVYANRDYANTRGVTLSLNKGFADHYGFDANYTFQVVEGSNSDPSEEFFASQGNQQPKLALLPLSWDQRHKIAGSVFTGGRNWGASVLAVWGSGFPYTPFFPEAAIVGSDVPPEFPTNSRRIPSGFQVDLSAHYEINVSGLRPRIFLQVYNLLDSRNANAVFTDTGEPDLTFVQPFASVDPGYFVRPEFYSEPRRVHLGVEIKF